MLTYELVYLLHGYDYCQEDPIICLSLALSSLGRAMQRQADNRNHLIAQVGCPGPKPCTADMRQAQGHGLSVAV